MENNKLTPCPICKGKARLVNGYGKKAFVHCVNCRFSTDMMLNETEAITEWNKHSLRVNEIGCPVGGPVFKGINEAYAKFMAERRR